MTIHIHHVPTHVVSKRGLGVRWCFVCRERVAFNVTITAPDDPMSYYGPNASVECERGHFNGDCFPGTYREWGEADT